MKSSKMFIFLSFIFVSLLPGCGPKVNVPPQKVRDVIKEMYNGKFKEDDGDYTTIISGEMNVKASVSNIGLPSCKYVSIGLYASYATDERVVCGYNSSIVLQWKDLEEEDIRDTVQGPVLYRKQNHIVGTFHGYQYGDYTPIDINDSKQFQSYLHEVDLENHTLGNQLEGSDSVTLDDLYNSYAKKAVDWFVNYVYSKTGVYYI